MLILESPNTHALYTMIRDKTHSQVIMLISGTIHAFIIEIRQGIKASKDLSRSLRVVIGYGEQGRDLYTRSLYQERLT